MEMFISKTLNLFKETIMSVHSVEETWVETLDASLPESIPSAKTLGALPPGLAKLKIRLAIQRWPNGEESHFRAELSDSLVEILRHGAEALGTPALPPHPAEPLDTLLCRRHGHEWESLADLQTPLWILLAEGFSRHFAIDFKTIIQINARWGTASNSSMSPRELLTSFGFDPAQFSLYYATSSDLLPPDTPLNIQRGDRFEAQKDGRYGFVSSRPPRGTQTIEEEIEELQKQGLDIKLTSQNSQRYVELLGLEIPSPPWSTSRADILIAVPGIYPQGGLDAFYLHTTVSHTNGQIPYQQSIAEIAGMSWALISWHYSQSRPWNPVLDDLASHIVHCRGFFLQRGIR